MTPIRMIWMSGLVMTGLAFVWILLRQTVFDPADKKKALAFLFLGFACLFAAGWFLFPPPEEGASEAPPLPAAQAPLPSA